MEDPTGALKNLAAPIKVASDLAGKLLGPAAEECGLYLQDRLRVWRQGIEEQLWLDGLCLLGSQLLVSQLQNLLNSSKKPVLRMTTICGTSGPACWRLLQ